MTRWLHAWLLAAALCGFAAPAAHADTYTQTRHPIVLVHGLFGFDKLFGVYDYWYGIPSALRAGGAQVIVVQVSAAQSTEWRGEQLLRQLQQLRATYGYTRFNLIGHSHGGPTARYVAAVAPSLVASVTTVGSPHQGSATADTIVAIANATGSTWLAAAAANGLGGVIQLVSGGPGPQDAYAAAMSLSSAGSRAFNARFPQGAPTTSCGEGAWVVNGVRYYSFGGRSVATNLFDPSDALLLASALPFGWTANDGLVSSCSSRWGMVVRADLPWNHLDEVNQAFGLRGLFTPDPVAVYRSHANRLKLAGL